MISIVDGFFWLLLLLLLLQPPFGTSRQFLISSAIRSVLRFASGMVISLATVRASSARSRQYFGSLIGTLAMGLLLEPIMATIALSVVSNCSPTRRLATSIAAITSLKSWQRRISELPISMVRSGSVPNHAGAHGQPHTHGDLFNLVARSRMAPRDVCPW